LIADHDCPFCAVGPERIVFEWSDGWGIWDGFPVSRGHLLIVPKRHAATWDDLTESEKAGAWAAVDRAILEIRQKHSPDGFNVGFNFGRAGGQTVFHFHLHVIPRYSGDVSDPRGGVRTVIPAKGNYLKNSELGEHDQQRLIKGGEDHFLPHLVLHMDKADIQGRKCRLGVQPGPRASAVATACSFRLAFRANSGIGPGVLTSPSIGFAGSTAVASPGR
jgi:diadenosine tetraphosphate (Ap4A) HIT family hydrolase